MSKLFITGAQMLAKSLRHQGCKIVFGNPGTTELTILDAINREGIKYVLALQETSAVAMADGYAQAARRPAVVNLHTIGGLGHAMGAIVNAKIANSPVIITAGQQDRRHIRYDPLLYGDAVALARSVVKYAVEVGSPDEIQAAVSLAFKTAMTPPRGPVFLSFPQDCMMELGTMSAEDSPKTIRDETATNLDELAKELSQYEAGQLVIIVCEDLHWSNGDWVSQISSVLEAPVFGPSWPGHISFPTAHDNWRGCLSPKFTDIRHTLQGFSGLLVIGTHPFIAYAYSDSTPTSPAQKVYQVSPVADTIGKYFPVTLGATGGLDSSLAELSRNLEHMVGNRDVRPRQDQKQTSSVSDAERKIRLETASPAADEFTPSVVARELVHAIGPEVTIVDEAPATMAEVRRCLSSWSPRQYVFTRSAILGWAMPAAIGTSLALSKPVVCLVGDGSAMYAPQALWSAVNLNAPVTFVVVNNSGYGILKKFRKSSNLRESIHQRDDPLELSRPAIDYLALARSMGMEGRRIGNISEIGPSIRQSILSMRPQLLEIPVVD